MSDLGPLPDDVSDFLDAERDLEHPEQPTRDRMFARLAPFVLPTGGGGGGGTTGPAAAGSATSATVKAAWRGKVMLSLISAAIGAAAGATTHAVLTSPRSEPATIAPRETSSSGLVPAPQATSEPAAPEPSSAATVVGSTPVSPSARAEQRVKSGGLLAERLLIESATEALTRGDSSSAIATLQRHAREFPKGQLVQEREALMVQALRASGDETSAQERAKDFKRKFPGSLQQGTVDKVSNPR